jgi:hypothetical protein
MLELLKLCLTRNIQGSNSVAVEMSYGYSLLHGDERKGPDVGAASARDRSPFQKAENGSDRSRSQIPH